MAIDVEGRTNRNWTAGRGSRVGGGDREEPGSLQDYWSSGLNGWRDQELILWPQGLPEEEV